jgi:hypothetical protein
MTPSLGAYCQGSALVTVVTVPDAVVVAPFTAPVAVVLVLCTGLPLDGLVPLPLPGAVPAAPLTAAPALETAWEAVLAAFEITF